MNDIAKKSISEKFTKAVQTEKLQVKDAAMIIGIIPTYASMIRNEALWSKCPIPVWEKALAWVNSGQSLKVYGEKHGHVLPAAPAPGVKELTPEEKDLLAWGKIAEDFIQPVDPDPEVRQYTESARLKVCLDIEINLVINGQKVQVK